MRIARRELAAVAVAVVLVAAAFVLPRLNWGINPRSDIGLERFGTHAGAAPIFGYWDIHAGWGTVLALLIAVATVVWGPAVAQRLSWRLLTLGHLGHRLRVGLFAGDDRRLAARLRRPVDHPRRVSVAGAGHHRHPGHGAEILHPDPRFPARLLDHARLGPSAGCAADVRVAGPDRPARRGLGRAAVPAGRLQRGGRGGDRQSARWPTNRPPGGPRRSSRWHRRRSGWRCRPTDTSRGSRRGVSRCWRWRCTAQFGSPHWSPPPRACCSAGGFSSVTA